MPREKRKKNDSLPCLIVARAAFGASLFYQEEDYLSYIARLRQLTRDRMIQVFAFCLKSHELRLIIKSERLPIGRVVQRLHGAHTLRVNARLQRHGSLFRGRYTSKLFLPTELGSAVRAIHLWPVRAGHVRRPEFFRFSSHCAYLGRTDHLTDFVQTNWLEEEFSGPMQNAQKAFARFVEEAALEGDSDGIVQTAARESEVNPLVHKKTGFLNRLAKRISLSFSVNLLHLKGPSRRQELVMARRLMATIAVLEAHRSVTEVADFLCRDKAQISRLVSQGMDLLDADTPFRSLYESVWQEKNRALNHE